MADTRPRPPATPTDDGGDGQALETTEHGVKVHEVPATTTEREFTVVRRSQSQMVIRRFMAHKLAVGSLVVFVLVVIVSLVGGAAEMASAFSARSEEHTSELQSPA